jgi:hypothetical protein
MVTKEKLNKTGYGVKHSSLKSLDALKRRREFQVAAINKQTFQLSTLLFYVGAFNACKTSEHSTASTYCILE